MPYYYGTPATSVRLYDSSRSEYVDLTHDLTRLESAARDGIREASDFLYVGFERRFDAIMFWLGQTGIYSGLKWEISAADSGWVEFIPVQQREYKFDSDMDYVRWDVNHPVFDAWRPVEVEGHTGYWIRVSTSDSVVVTISGDVTTSVDLAPIISSGQIGEIIINDGGTGYSTDTILEVFLNGVLTNAILEVDSVDNNGAIVRVNVLDGGSFSGDDRPIVRVRGENASMEGISLSNTVYEFNEALDDTDADTIMNTSQTVTVTVDAAAPGTGRVTGVNIDTAGFTYDPNPNIIYSVTFDDPPNSGVTAQGRAIISSSGTVSRIDITEEGMGYTSVPNAIIDAPLGSTGRATGTAVVTHTPVQLRHTANGGGYTDVIFDLDVYIISSGNIPSGVTRPALKDDTRRIVIIPDTDTALAIDIGGDDTYSLSIGYPPTGARQRATINALSVRPYAYAASPKDVREQLQLEDDYDDETTPTDHTIERYLRGAEDGIYHITYHYFRPEFVEDERLNFEAYGMALRHQPILDILDLSVFNGNNYETKIEGRNRDWHYEPHTGMIHISTLFLDVIPPILRRGYSERRNQGAYKRAVRVRYIHGHDANTDPHSVEVGRIVTKQACIDIVSSQDFQRLLPQGLDRVTLQEKIRFWKEEVDAFTDRYAKLRLY